MNFEAMGLSGIWQSESSLPSAGCLLVILHGRGDSAEGFAGFRGALGLPGLSVLLLNAPDEQYGGYSWYDLAPNQLPGILRSRALLEKAFAELERLGFSAQRTFLLGFSQGCLMTLEFGGRHAVQLAGYIGISGYCYNPAQLLKEASVAARQGRWLITHGTADEVLSVEQTRDQIRQLIDGGFPVEYREYPKAHTIEVRHELSYIRQWISQIQQTL